MKPGIHPEYRPVVFRDRGADFAFLTRSIEWSDGNTYPPFWTGRRRIPDSAGRVEQFRARYARVRQAERPEQRG